MAEEEELREELRRLADELGRMKEEIGGEVGRLAGAIGVLATEVRARVRPEEVEEIRRMVSEVRTFHEGLLLPWRREIAEEMETRRLWADRIALGECELEHRIEGKYAIYESYHHIPTSERWVWATPRPYTRQY